MRTADRKRRFEQFGIFEDVRRGSRARWSTVITPQPFRGPELYVCVNDHRAAFYVTLPHFVLSDHPPTMNDHIDDDSRSDVDSDIFSVRSAPSSVTSHDVSMRSGSPAPSIYSVTSSIRAASYRQEFGRGLNNYSEVYQLPADDEELDRLGMMSFVITL